MMISLLATLALATVEPAPVAHHDLDALLAKPVSPGVIALLLPHLANERAAARVIESLAHSDPAVRATAARVSGVASLTPARAAVGRALESETDRSAATEQLRASIFLAPLQSALSLTATARQHGLVDLFAQVLGNVGGPATLLSLDALREAGLTEAAEHTLIGSATRRGREGLNIAGAGALRAGSTGRWSTVLSLARQPRAVLSPGLLMAAVGSSKPEIRALTYWHLALTAADGLPLSPELEAAIARTPDAAPSEPADVDAAFALVALRRAQQGVGYGGDWGERAATGNPMTPVDPEGRMEPIGRFLTKTEARALSRRLTGRDGAFEGEKKRVEPGTTSGGAHGGLWFAGGLPPGTLRDMLAVTGCKPGADRRVAGLVEYRPDGRPRRISVAENPLLPRGCAQAAGPALGLTLAPPGVVDLERPERRTVVIVPLDEEALECADEPELEAAERVPDEPGAPPGKIREPRKVRNVAPWYPKHARDERREGTVVLEAVISPSGCIRSARVIRGVSPDLDGVAMIAVGQWRYTPTLLRGKPVPVIMTVTVNFRLS